VNDIRNAYTSMHESELTRFFVSLLVTKLEADGLTGPVVPTVLKFILPIVSKLIVQSRESTIRRRGKF